MHALLVISLPSFTYTKDMIRAQKFKNSSHDLDCPFRLVCRL